MAENEAVKSALTPTQRAVLEALDKYPNSDWMDVSDHTGMHYGEIDTALDALYGSMHVDQVYRLTPSGRAALREGL